MRSYIFLGQLPVPAIFKSLVRDYPLELLSRLRYCINASYQIADSNKTALYSFPQRIAGEKPIGYEVRKLCHDLVRVAAEIYPLLLRFFENMLQVFYLSLL